MNDPKQILPVAGFKAKERRAINRLGTVARRQQAIATPGTRLHVTDAGTVRKPATDTAPAGDSIPRWL